jgi:hypothetical protein
VSCSSLTWWRTHANLRGSSVLNLPPTASDYEIRDRYRQLSIQYHPDKQRDESAKEIASKQFLKIQKAYQGMSVLTPPSHTPSGIYRNERPPSPVRSVSPVRAVNTETILINSHMPPDSIVYDTLGKASPPCSEVLDGASPPYAVPLSFNTFSGRLCLSVQKSIVIAAALHAKHVVYPRLCS